MTSERNIRRTVLPSGLIVLTERMEHVRSVAMGVWMRAGSRHEVPELNGISHFVEHMVFKGTKSRSAQRIAREVDAIGGNLDAFHRQRNRLLQHQGSRRACADRPRCPLRPGAESGLRHRGNRPRARRDPRRDQDGRRQSRHPGPRNFHAEFLEGSSARQAHPGHARDGRAVSSRTRSSRFFEQRFQCRQHGLFRRRQSRARQLCRVGRAPLQLAGPRQRARRQRWRPTVTPRIHLRNKKSLEQVQLCLGVPAPPIGDESRYTTLLLNTILGGGMSSRLFQTVREERGLVYAIYSDLAPLSRYRLAVRLRRNLLRSRPPGH